MQPVVGAHVEAQHPGQRARGLLGTLQRGGHDGRHVAGGQVGGDGLGHPLAARRQPVPRQPAVHHAVGVVHLAVADEVDHGAGGRARAGAHVPSPGGVPAASAEPA